MSKKSWRWRFAQLHAEPSNHTLLIDKDKELVNLSGSLENIGWHGSKTAYTLEEFIEMFENGTFEGRHHPMMVVIHKPEMFKEIVDFIDNERLTTYYESRQK